MKLHNQTEQAIYAAAFVRRLTSRDGVPPEWKGDPVFVGRQEAVCAGHALVAAEEAVRFYRLGKSKRRA